jgi:hypothetical protein
LEVPLSHPNKPDTYIFEHSVLCSILAEPPSMPIRSVIFHAGFEVREIHVDLNSIQYCPVEHLLRKHKLKLGTKSELRP